MAVNIHKNYPQGKGVLEDNYEANVGAGLQAGMMAVLGVGADITKLSKATGSANEYAMLCMNDQPVNFIENAGKIQVVKENGSFWTDKYKVGVGYTPMCRLQVSVAGGEEGILTIHAGAGAPVVGRYQRIESKNGVNMMLFDLTRS